MKPEMIGQLVNEAGIAPCKINLMTTKDPRYFDQCNYLLHFDGSSPVTLAKLKETKAINYTIVSWAHYKVKKSGVSICRNCCTFGHGASNCHLVAKCTICAEPHSYKECRLLKGKHEGRYDQIHKKHIKCASCGADHTATYSNCPARLAYIEAQPRRKPKRQPELPRRNSTPPPAMNDQNFPRPAFAAPTYNLAVTHPATSAPAQPQRSSAELFTMEECKEMLDSLYSALQACTSKAQQAKVIADYSLKYFCNFP